MLIYLQTDANIPVCASHDMSVYVFVVKSRRERLLSLHGIAYQGNLRSHEPCAFKDPFSDRDEAHGKSNLEDDGLMYPNSLFMTISLETKELVEIGIILECMCSIRLSRVKGICLIKSIIMNNNIPRESSQCMMYLLFLDATGSRWQEICLENVSPFLPEASFGPRVLSLPACVCVCVCLSVNHQLVRAITHQPFKLESPNLYQRCKRPWLISLLYFGTIDLELQGQIELKNRNLPHFELVRAKSHHQLKSVFPNLGQKCILAL